MKKTIPLTIGIVDRLIMKSAKAIGYALVALSVVGFGIYKHNDMKATKKSAEGNCGCSKKLVKSAPLPTLKLSKKAVVQVVGSRIAVYNPLLIHPMFDPNEYQTQDLDNMGQPVNPYNYSPYQQTRRSFIVSNLGGGI